MTVITTSKELRDFCAAQKKADYITVDTEFMREKTFWPILCLIQVAGPEDAAAIDPLARDIDLKPFYSLMNDKKILKVMHGARQDVEIFYHETKKIPEPLFDTQIAAMVCGFGDQVSYEKLAHDLLGAKIHKDRRYSDWAQRPLSEKQISYALEDVTYLRPAYEKLKKRIEKFDRMSWLEEELAVLTNPKTYDIDPEDIWQRIKIRGSKPKLLAILREITAWREREAQAQNVPRGRIMKDATCVDLAVNAPAKIEDLKKIRGLSSSIRDTDKGKALIAAIEKGRKTPEKDCPKPPKKPHLPPGIGPTVELLKVLLRLKSEEHMVAPRLLATIRDIELLAADDKADIPALKGWRREVFGEDALALKHGRLALSVDKNKIKVVKA